MRCTFLILATLLSQTHGLDCELTEDGQCLGAVPDENHVSSLLQVKGARAEDRSKAPPKCDPTVKSSSKASWEKILDSEIGYWDGRIKEESQKDHTKQRELTYWERFERDRKVPADFRPYLNLPQDPTQSTEVKFLKILVVGSGPGSDVGYSDYEDAKINLVLTDPLAKAYESLYKKHNTYPPQQGLAMGGEELECFFAPDVFNLVYSANALDHSYDPVEAMRQMVRVAVPCSWVIVELFENEAKAEGGQGLHQWNFHMDGNRVKLEKYNSATIPIDVNDEMHKVGAEMSALLGHQCFLHGGCVSDKKRIRMTIRKLGAGGEECPLDWIGEDSRVAF